MTLLDFQRIIMITVTIQVAILNQFSWNSHGWCDFTHGWILFFFFFFYNSWSNRTIDMGENVPPKLVYWLSLSRYGLSWRKHFKAVSGTPIPIEKVILIFDVWHPILQKMVMPPKNYFFAVILIFFFFLKKLLYEKYLEPHFLQKRLY